jgi:hypothetical protein
MSNNEMTPRGTVTEHQGDEKDKAESREVTPELVNDDYSPKESHSSSSNDSDSSEFQELTPALLEAMREAEQFYAEEEPESIPRGYLGHFDMGLDMDMTAWQDDVERRYGLFEVSEVDIARPNQTQQPVSYLVPNL